MITFDIVRVNKSNYINRYYINIALGYIKHTIYLEPPNSHNHKKTASTKLNLNLMKAAISKEENS